MGDDDAGVPPLAPRVRLPVNKNFAGQLPLLDVVFGTAHLPRGAMPAAYGIPERTPDSYLEQLAWPFETEREVAVTAF